MEHMDMEVEDGSDSDQSINELDSNKPVVHSETLKAACSLLLDMYMDEEHLRIGLDIGRALRWRELHALGLLNSVPDENQIVDAPGMDIFGNPLTKKYNFECECPKCHRNVASSRFAPHLEKCMGMGRNSSRVASRRLAASANNANNNGGNSNDAARDTSKNSGQASSSTGPSQNPVNGELGSEDDHFEEDDDDEDWSMDRKKKSKKPNEKVAVKRSATNRL